MSQKLLTIYTIGHSTHAFSDFVALLKAHGIQRLIDVRAIPKSRYNPQFNRDHLEKKLPTAGISYLHLAKLGGLRRATKDSVNQGWRNVSFRGYADYMATEEFRSGLGRVLKLARTKQSAIMCAEAVPWRCHRSLISDALLVLGMRVEHVMNEHASRPHKLTPFAKNGNISYPKQVN